MWIRSVRALLVALVVCLMAAAAAADCAACYPRLNTCWDVDLSPTETPQGWYDDCQVVTQCWRFANGQYCSIRCAGMPCYWA